MKGSIIPEPSLISEFRVRSDDDEAEFVQCFDRLNTLAEIRFERPLSSKELQELVELRVDLRNRLSAWPEKR